MLNQLRAVAERLIPDRSLLVRWACLLYAGHLAFQGKIATSEILAGFCVVLVYIAVRKGELRLTWNILYYPLFLYCLASTISSLVAPTMSSRKAMASRRVSEKNSARVAPSAVRARR